MTWQIITIIILITLSGVFQAVQDTLVHHWPNSVFGHLAKRYKIKAIWWNPEISWENKYKGGNPDRGEKFPGSTTIFVFVTDAWHMFGFLSTTSFQMAMALAITWSWWAFVWVMGIKFIYSVSFQITYRWLERD